MGIKNIALISIVFFSAIRAGAEELTPYLERFHRNPQEVLNERPVKMNIYGEELPVESPFTEEEIQSGGDIESRIALRHQMGCKVTKSGFRFCLKNYRPGRSAIQDSDSVDELLGGDTPIKIIPQLEGQKTKSAALDIIPWSSSYWPIAKGQIANRYADSGNPKSADWQVNYGYFLLTPPALLLAAGRLNSLSPAEKYDYLTGNGGFSLTYSMWSKVQRYAAENGVVPRWTGICHGWAPAALTFEEPVRAVTVQSANGGSVRFTPTDVKALASQLWAEETELNFVGGKCARHNPPRDAIGRVSAPECHDTNPGTWHMAITNLIGIHKRGFIMDATYDYEVWNHPVYAYDFTYFNPQTLEPTPLWRSALVPIERYTIDKFKPYRAQGTKYVIGVAMNVRYVVETNPTSAEKSQKLAKMVRYVYDLELDANHQIIGGEWYTNKHPDWLWTPKSHRPVSTGIAELSETWTGEGPLPESWASAARSVAGRREVLTAIVDTLVNLSK